MVVTVLFHVSFQFCNENVSHAISCQGNQILKKKKKGKKGAHGRQILQLYSEINFVLVIMLRCLKCYSKL